ncbi:hypothetical protein LIS04_130 [Listeria phage LIS04]|nr:hypothetical protein LIS04_130 [Listeria phage LIS04]
MSNIRELESVVKQIYGEDRTNPDLYLALRNLAEKLLVVKKLATTRDEVQAISHHLASDLYMDILAGKEVQSWTKYVYLRLFKYREYYIKDKGKQFFTAKNTSQVDEIKNLHSGSKYYFNDMANVEYEDLISQLPKVFMEKYVELVRYTKNHPDYDNLLLSVIITVTRDQVFLYKVPEHYSSYVRLMARAIQKECYEYVRKYSEESGPKLNEFTSYFEVVYDG